MTTVAKRELRPTHPGSLTVPYCTPLPIHLPPRISFNPTSTSGCSGSTVITDTRAHGLVVVAFVCIVSDMGLGPNGTINGIGKERKGKPSWFYKTYTNHLTLSLVHPLLSDNDLLSFSMPTLLVSTRTLSVHA